MKNIFRLVILFELLISLFVSNAYSSNLLEQKMKEFQNQLNQIKPQLKGSIISVSGKDYNFSYASTDTNNESQFYIGSLGKQITAVILLKTLQEQYPEKDLEELLNKKLSELFNNSKFLKEIDKSWVQDITLLELLTHTSGLQDYLDFYQSEALNTPIDSIKILQTIGFNSLKTYTYSNSNYLLLGKLIEEMNNLTYEEVFDVMIKKPSNMANSYAPNKGNYDIFKKDIRFKKLKVDLNDKHFVDFANVGGAGEGISTSEDLLKWNYYLHKRLDPKLKNLVLTNYFFDEGDGVNLGLITVKTNIGKCVGFQGGIDSYRSFLTMCQDQDLNIVILSNNNEDFELLLGSFNNIFVE